MSGTTQTERPAGPIRFVAVLIATGMVHFAAVASVAAQSTGPMPTNTGPILATAPLGDPSHGFVFSPAAVDLGPRGMSRRSSSSRGRPTVTRGRGWKQLK